MDGPVADQLAQAADLGGHVQELLPAETGIDRHHADQIGQIQQMRDRIGRRAGVQRHTRLFAGGTDRLQGAVDMRTGLDMGGDQIGPRLGIGLDIGIDRRDHQVNVHEGLHMRAERLHGGRAEGQVRHEMSVHHIDMDPVGALILDGPDLAAEIGKIGGQDRRRDPDLAVECHGWSLSTRLPSMSSPPLNTRLGRMSASVMVESASASTLP